jgi:hypothetical protein
MGKVRELHIATTKPVFRDQLITVADLAEFKNDLLVSIRHLLLEKPSQPQKKWLKSYEVKKLLNISGGTLQSLRNNRTLPFTKIGGIIYYDSEDIDKMMQDSQKRFFPDQLTKRKI